jgi:transcriptional regulator with XRE-family HTH domain
MYRNEKIRGRQAELGWSNEVFADKAGLHENTISALRNGKPVTNRSLEKAAVALGLSMAGLYDNTTTSQIEEPVEA